MSIQNRIVGHKIVQLTSSPLTLTGTPVTVNVQPPTNRNVVSLGKFGLGDYVQQTEIWRPLGIHYAVTTTTTANATVVRLSKNGTVVASGTAGGDAVIPVVAAPSRGYCEFSDYSAALATGAAFGADVSGDYWGCSVTVSPGAGAAMLWLDVALISVPTITEAIPAGGTGYTSVPTVVFTPLDLGAGSAAAGTAVLNGTSVSKVTMTNAGTGYTVPPRVTFTGGGGYGAEAVAVMSGTTVASVTIVGL